MSGKTPKFLDLAVEKQGADMATQREIQAPICRFLSIFRKWNMTVFIVDAEDGTDMTEAEELLPCPFCGAEPMEKRIQPHKHHLVQMPNYPGAWSVECVKCEVRVFDHNNRANAVAKWNRRAPADGVVVPPLAEIRGAVARGWCHKVNEHKTMDTDLAPAIADEVNAMLSAAPSVKGGTE
jgi:Lar family restriction alleviation protein